MTWKEAKREMMFAKRNVLEGSYIDQAYDKAIEALSQPERKKGHWKLLNNGDAICSECGRKQKGVWDFDNWDNFCRHCGSDMRGGEG